MASREAPPGTKRLAVVLAVAAFFVAGIPAWWKLTEVYRAPLPFQEIEALSQSLKVENVGLPCQVQVLLSTKAKTLESEAFVEGLREDLELELDGCGCRLDLSVKLEIEAGFVTEDLLAEDQMIDEVLKERSRATGGGEAGRYRIFVFLGTRGEGRAVLGKYRHAWVTGYDHSHREELRSTISQTVKIMLKGGSGEAPALPVAADGSATLSFSLLNANPSDWIFDWNFHELQQRFLAPITKLLAPVARLSVESQVLYYTPNNGRPKWDARSKSYVIRPGDASFFVNANEWHLDTSSAAAGRSKVLHFAIYVPSASECPLRLKLGNDRLSSTNGFTSPGWGGVLIWNPPDCTSRAQHRLKEKDLLPVMEVFVAQLRSLFGLSAIASPKVVALPNVNTGFADWEIDLLLRRRSVADVYDSVSSLSSLSRLVKSLPNMVIQDEIGGQVRTSLVAAKIAVDGQQVSNYSFFSEMAREAKESADAAFFHPSIMSLLHFPKEHLFAIYTPFFAPVLAHTVLSVAKETRRYFRERKKHRQR